MNIKQRIHVYCFCNLYKLYQDNIFRSKSGKKQFVNLEGISSPAITEFFQVGSVPLGALQRQKDDPHMSNRLGEIQFVQR